MKKKLMLPLLLLLVSVKLIIKSGIALRLGLALLSALRARF